MTEGFFAVIRDTLGVTATKLSITTAGPTPKSGTAVGVRGPATSAPVPARCRLIAIGGNDDLGASLRVDHDLGLNLRKRSLAGDRPYQLGRRSKLGQKPEVPDRREHEV